MYARISSVYDRHVPREEGRNLNKTRTDRNMNKTSTDRNIAQGGREEVEQDKHSRNIFFIGETHLGRLDFS